jgi:hypothetical protein
MIGDVAAATEKLVGHADHSAVRQCRVAPVSGGRVPRSVV